MVFKSALEARSELFRMDLEGFAYQSPIEIIKGDMEAKMQEGVLRAVQKFDVNVDEEELRKALAYDRAQYEKGYADAMRFATDTNIGGKWIPVTADTAPEKFVHVQCYFPEKDYGSKIMVSYNECEKGRFPYFCSEHLWGHPSHWMPLPPAPKE